MAIETALQVLLVAKAKKGSVVRNGKVEGSVDMDAMIHAIARPDSLSSVDVSYR